MESTDSLVSQAASLPPAICENPDYLPPALPPKRHRTSTKLNNLNSTTPPSSPPFILNDSAHEIPTIDLSSQNLNNNNNLLNNNRNKVIIGDIIKSEPSSISPTSNYVQMSTSKMNAAAANEAATTTKPNNEINKPTIEINSSAANTIQNCENDVRVIYTNVNNLNTTNNHNTKSDQSVKLKVNDQQNSQINNNNNNITIKTTDDDAVADDDEDVVVLRRPQPSPNNSLKVCFQPFFF